MLRGRHELLAAHVPVPHPWAATPDGIVVLPELPGTPLRLLLSGDEPLPDGRTLDELLDRLPEAVTELPARTDHLGRVQHYTAVLTRTAVTNGPVRDRLDALAARLADADAGEHPVLPTHGDFYEAQLLARNGAVTGLLDVDTAGPGHHIDEWATLLAHLSILRGPGPRRYGGALLAYAEQRLDPTQLRLRIAAAVVGLATNPFRVQQPDWPRQTADRIALAEQWLAGA